MTDNAAAQALARYAATRDAQAFNDLVRAYHAMVFGVCVRVLRDPADAADAAQEAFVALARKAGQVRGDVGCWLHGAARRAALHHARRRGTARRVERAAARPEVAAGPDAAWAEVRDQLDEVVASLPPDDRRLIVERFFAGRTQQEMADALGISQSLVSRRLDQAVGRLRRALARRGVTATAVVLTERMAGEAQATAAASTAAGVPAKATAVGLAGVAPAQASLALAIGALVTTKAALAAAAVFAVVAWVVAGQLAGDGAGQPAATAPSPNAAADPWNGIPADVVRAAPRRYFVTRPENPDRLYVLELHTQVTGERVTMTDRWTRYEEGRPAWTLEAVAEAGLAPGLPVDRLRVARTATAPGADPWQNRPPPAQANQWLFQAAAAGRWAMVLDEEPVNDPALDAIEPGDTYLEFTRRPVPLPAVIRQLGGLPRERGWESQPWPLVGYFGIAGQPFTQIGPDAVVLYAGEEPLAWGEATGAVAKFRLTEPGLLRDGCTFWVEAETGLLRAARVPPNDRWELLEPAPNFPRGDATANAPVVRVDAWVIDFAKPTNEVRTAAVGRAVRLDASGVSVGSQNPGDAAVADWSEPAMAAEVPPAVAERLVQLVRAGAGREGLPRVTAAPRFTVRAGAEATIEMAHRDRQVPAQDPDLPFRLTVAPQVEGNTITRLDLWSPSPVGEGWMARRLRFSRAEPGGNGNGRAAILADFPLRGLAAHNGRFLLVRATMESSP